VILDKYSPQYYVTICNITGKIKTYLFFKFILFFEEYSLRESNEYDLSRKLTSLGNVSLYQGQIDIMFPSSFTWIFVVSSLTALDARFVSLTYYSELEKLWKKKHNSV
jgi:hypothetical protein